MKVNEAHLVIINYEKVQIESFIGILIFLILFLGEERSFCCDEDKTQEPY